jgi:hypothetical protein
MAWTTKIAAGAADLLKVDQKNLVKPVKDALPNLQAFVQSVDAAEKLDFELRTEYAEYLTAEQKLKQKIAKYKALEAAINKNLATYDKSCKDYIKVGRERPEKAYATGCTQLDKGIDEIQDNIKFATKPYANL